MSNDKRLLSFTCVAKSSNQKSPAFYDSLVDKADFDKAIKADAIPLLKLVSEVIIHERPISKIKMGNNVDWIITWANDGIITIRSLSDVEKDTRIFAHDSNNGGVLQVVSCPMGKSLVSLGSDGTIKTFKWQTSAIGKRALLDSENEWDRYISTNAAIIKRLCDISVPSVEDVADTDSEAVLYCKVVVNETENIDSEKEVFKNNIEFCFENKGQGF